MRFWITIIICLTGWVSLLAQNKAKKLALLIGNGKYTYSRPLANPINDVDSLYKVLRNELGFEVTRKKNLERRNMQKALDDFERSIQAAVQRYDTVITLFYYSGHGMQDDYGNNFLLPLNSNIVSIVDLKERAIKLQNTLDRLKNHGNFLNIVMLDACRNNPLTKSLATTKGLDDDLFEGYAPPKNSSGTSGMFLSFATAEGATADSGDRRLKNSPYIGAFLRYVRTPNLSINTLFDKLSQDVFRSTRRTQEPWTLDRFYDEFTFLYQPKQSTFGDNISSIAESRRTTIPTNMVLVTAGSFQMGSKDGGSDEKNIHTVTLSPFVMDKTEVTFAMYDAFCEDTGRSKPSDSGWGRGNRPVIYVDWYDAIEYCNWRSQQEGLQEVYDINKSHKDPNNQNSADDKKWLVTCDWRANGYRLPTEAEWEYAAGGGKRQPDKWAGTNSSNDLDQYANICDGNCDYNWADKKLNDGYKHTSPVSTYQPNALGLYDMSGNVWEWCWDWKKDYPTTGQTDPHGPNGGKYRVVRGGSWSTMISTRAWLTVTQQSR